MKTVAQQIRSEKKNLLKYAGLRSGNDTVYLSDFITKPPYSQTQERLMEALFQQKSRRLTDQIIFTKTLEDILTLWQTNEELIMTKAISYPSTLRNNFSKDVMKFDNIWILDLFTRGVEFKKNLGNGSSFFVINTSIYEGLNRFSEQDFIELINLPVINPAEKLVNNFLELLNKPSYSYIQKNEIIRDCYCTAISSVCNLPPSVNIRSIMLSQPFTDTLNKLLEQTDSFEIFTNNKNIQSRNFSAFVLAEEIAVRSLYGVNSYLGPLREELLLDNRILEFSNLIKSKPMPLIWYTRPTKIPEINFNDRKEKINELIQFPIVKKYVLENLIRLGRLSYEITDDVPINILTNSLWDLMQDINNIYKNEIRMKGDLVYER